MNKQNKLVFDSSIPKPFKAIGELFKLCLRDPVISIHIFQLSQQSSRSLQPLTLLLSQLLVMTILFSSTCSSL